MHGNISAHLLSLQVKLVESPVCVKKGVLFIGSMLEN